MIIMLHVLPTCQDLFWEWRIVQLELPDWHLAVIKEFTHNRMIWHYLVYIKSSTNPKTGCCIYSAACNRLHGHICPSFDSKVMQFVYFLSFQDNRISLVDYVVSYYLHNVDEVMDVPWLFSYDCEHIRSWQRKKHFSSEVKSAACGV